MSEKFNKAGPRTFTADHLSVQKTGEVLAFSTSDEGSEPEFAYLNVAQVRELVAYLNKVLPETSGPTERERAQMCGPDPVRNSDLGL